MVQLSEPYKTTRKTTALTIRTFVGRVMSLLSNTLSRFAIALLPRSNRLLISWLQSPSTVTLEPNKRKSVTTSTFSPSICHEVMGLDAMILVFLIFSFKPALSLSSFTVIQRLLSTSSLSAIRVVSSVYLSCWYFSHLSWFQLLTHPAWHFPWCAQSCPILCDAMNSILYMGCFRQAYWNGLLFSPPGDLLHQVIKPLFPALQADSLPTESWGKPF